MLNYLVASTRKWPTTDLRHDKRLNCVWKIYCNSLCGPIGRLYSLRKSPVEELWPVICFEDILGQELEPKNRSRNLSVFQIFLFVASGHWTVVGIFSSLLNEFSAKTPKIFAYFLYSCDAASSSHAHKFVYDACDWNSSEIKVFLNTRTGLMAYLRLHVRLT